jgi:hypothetical protein
MSTQACVIYKCVVEHSSTALDAWLDQATEHYGR